MIRTGDLLRSVDWSEHNNCYPIREGGKRKVMVYGDIVDGVEFETEIEAEQRLFEYRKWEKDTVLLDDLDNNK